MRAFFRGLIHVAAEDSCIVEAAEAIDDASCMDAARMYRADSGRMVTSDFNDRTSSARERTKVSRQILNHMYYIRSV